jgi:hypothetical protein
VRAATQALRLTGDRASEYGYGATATGGAAVSAYRTASLDEIAAEKWPYWAPIRHHFGISTFGINAWRGDDAGASVITEHDESESGAPELYVVLSGAAAFRVAGDEVAAPAGTLVWVDDPSATRSAVATEPGTLVLSIGGGAPGRAFEPSGWDSGYLTAD